MKSGASLAVLSLLMGGAASASVLPSHGHFVSGQGQIGKAGQSLTVKQSSTTGIINWNSFSVGKKNSVSFDNGSGATLNRVTGSNLSTIAGQLHATGTLYLMNNSGVIVSGTGHVVTGGSFVATSSNIVNSAFGTEDQKHRTATAAVINHGTITAGGRAALFGSTVTNTGSITGAFVALRGQEGTNAGGSIHATGNASHNGRVLVISKSGETKITGDLSARNADGTGGHIETSGQHVAIGGTIDAGKGGNWLVDPVNLVVTAPAAKTINNALNAGTNVKLKTAAHGASGPGISHAGPGDIEIKAALSWNTTAALTLDAYHSVHFNDAVNVTGKGGVNIAINDGGTGGELRFLAGGMLNFASRASDLTIDGERYTLVDNIAELASDANVAPSGDYALTSSFHATTTAYGDSPVTATFTGTFEGLGHTIKGLTLDNAAAGLFFDIGAGGSVDYLSLTDVHATLRPGAFPGEGILAGTMEGDALGISVSGVLDVKGHSAGAVGALFGIVGNTSEITNVTSNVKILQLNGHGGNNVEAASIGGVAGESAGTITDAEVKGSMTCAYEAVCGGVAGENSGLITGANVANMMIDKKENGISYLGGVAGKNDGTISASTESGSFSSVSVAGGLVAENDSGAVVENSFATGTISGSTVGGLVGSNDGGASIESSYATGAVSGDFVGGLVGSNGGSITLSYATGDVSAQTGGGLVGDNGGDITESYATGSVSGSTKLGGLVGEVAGGNITNAYATGSVSSDAASADLGGLVGYIYGPGGGSISETYATGAVSGVSGSSIGGFAGFLNGSANIASSYWDKDTAGTHAAVGNTTGVSGIEGLKTAQFQSGLPLGFDSSVWAENSSINNGLPYLIALASSY